MAPATALKEPAVTARAFWAKPSTVDRRPPLGSGPGYDRRREVGDGYS